MAGRQAGGGQHLVRSAVPARRAPTWSSCWSETVDVAGRGAPRSSSATVARVGRVGDQEDVLVGAPVGDQVVDDTAVVVADQGVLRLAGGDLVQVGGQAAVDEGGRARAR